MNTIESLESWLGGLPSAVEEESEACSRSFETFCQRAWPRLEPDTRVLWEPVHRAMALHIQELICGFVRVKLYDLAQGYAHGLLPRVSTARLPLGRREREAELRERARVAHLWAVGRRLEVLLDSGRVEHRPQLFTFVLVNVGTGMGKTRIACVFAPAWLWLWWPSAVEQSFSVNPRGAAKEAGAQLDLVTSDWWRTTFRPWWGMSLAKSAVSNFRNTAGGARMALGWGAQAQGDHSHFQMVDDPEDPKKVYSDGERKATKQSWDGKIRRRVIPGGTAIRIVVQQRLLDDDFSNHVLRTEEDVEHVELPTEATAEPSPCECATHKRGHSRVIDPATGQPWRDTRKPLELIAPRLVPPKDVAGRKAAPLIWKAQDQQRPDKLEGKVFPADKWRFWRFHEEPEADSKEMRDRTIVLPPRSEWSDYFEEMLLSGDLSFGVSNDGSKDALGAWGRRGSWRILVDLEWDHMRMTQARDAVRRLLKDNPHIGPKVLERAANAGAVADSLSESAERSSADGKEVQKEESIEGVILQPAEGSKVLRGLSIQHLHEAMNIIIPLHHSKRPEMVSEGAAFPRKGKRNDFIDMMTLAIRYWQKHDTERRQVEGLTSMAWAE